MELYLTHFGSAPRLLSIKAGVYDACSPFGKYGAPVLIPYVPLASVFESCVEIPSFDGNVPDVQFVFTQNVVILSRHPVSYPVPQSSLFQRKP